MQSNRGFRTLGLVVLVLSSCKTRSEMAGLRSTTNQLYKTNLIVQCGTPQGNGGNWAATLGWIAEDWMTLSERATLIQSKTSRPTYVFMRCMSGGSSGSAATNVTMNLLKNQAVLKSEPDSSDLWDIGFFTPSEVRDYARAMRFLANSVDMNVTETAYFFLTMFEEMIAAQLQESAGSESLQELAKRHKDRLLGKIVFQHGGNSSSRESNGANWWKGSVASASGAVADFGKLVHAATLLKYEHVNKPIQEIINEKALKHVTERQLLLEYGAEKGAAVIAAIGKWVLADVHTGGLTPKDFYKDVTAYATRKNINNAADFSLASTIEELNCSTKDTACSLPAAAMKLAMNEARTSTWAGQQLNKLLSQTEQDKSLNYASNFLVESAQAYYAGLVVDALSQNRDIHTYQPTSVNAAEVFEESLNAILSPQEDTASKVKLPLLETLAQPMDPGYFTITAAALAPDGQTFRHKTKPKYKDLRMILLGSDSTLQAILSSKLYQNHTSGCSQPSEEGERTIKAARPRTDASPFTCRFVLTTVNHAVYSMLPSVREPGLMSELYVPALAQDPNSAGLGHMGITALFDPQKTSTPEAITLESGQSTWFAVGGGWPDRRVGNWMMMYYMDTLLNPESAMSLQQAYTRATGRNSAQLAITAAMSIFGKPDRSDHWSDAAIQVNSDPIHKAKFDVKAVGEIFTSDADDANAARNDYLTFLATYYQFFGFGAETGSAQVPDRLLSERDIPFQLRENMLHWDMRENGPLFRKFSNLPSFIILSESGGASRFLNKLAHNGIRETIRETNQFLTENGDWPEKQICSLAKVEADTRGNSNLRRIYCSRTLAHRSSITRESQLFGADAGYRSQLADLAAQPGYTFSVMDPRITLSRSDSDDLVMGHQNITMAQAQLAR